MTLTYLNPQSRSRHLAELNSAPGKLDICGLQLFDQPHKLGDGVLALRRYDGLWCELSGLPNPLAKVLAANTELHMADFGPVGLSPGDWRNLLLGLLDAGLGRALPEASQLRRSAAKHAAFNSQFGAGGQLHVLGTGALADRLRTSLRGHRLELVVVCLPTIEPDRGLLRELDATQQPYLVVRADRNWASIGPHVFPGAGGLCCLDQHAVDDDSSSWQMLLRLTQTTAAPADWVADWVVGQLAAQLRAIAAGRSQLTRATVSLADDGEQLWATWDRHAQCCATRTATRHLALAA